MRSQRPQDDEGMGRLPVAKRIAVDVLAAIGGVAAPRRAPARNRI